MKKENSAATYRDVPSRTGAQDGRSRPGGAGDKGQHLKYTDQEDRFVVEFLEIVDPRFLVAAFHPDEEDTVDNQGSRDDRGQGQFLIDDIVEKDADDAGRNARDEHLSPKGKGSAALQRGFFAGKGIELVEKKHQHRHDRTKLHQHLEHFEKGFVAFRIRGYGKGQKFI